MNAAVDINESLKNFAQMLETDADKANIEKMGVELDALRDSVLNDLGERDIEYMRSVMKWQKRLDIAGRASLFLGFLPPFWVAGAGMLGVAKILENMEIGHNIMHGQFNWTGDPKMHSDTYEWDLVVPSKHWKFTHNFEHHTYTNVLGKDKDIGYGLLRMDDSQYWDPRYLVQLLSSKVMMLFFQNFIAFHYLRTDEWMAGKLTKEEKAKLKSELPLIGRKFFKHTLKDYVLFPLLAGPFFLFVLTGNIAANLIRNIWSYLIIFCGHFPQEVETFPKSVVENETKAQWYLRQIKGSANIKGGKLMHIMSGNLSHQIEHHLFPDMPANRYQEIAPKVREICEKYGVNYNTGSFGGQLKTVYGRILKMSLPPEKTKSSVGKWINKARKFK